MQLIQCVLYVATLSRIVWFAWAYDFNYKIIKLMRTLLLDRNLYPMTWKQSGLEDDYEDEVNTTPEAKGRSKPSKQIPKNPKTINDVLNVCNSTLFQSSTLNCRCQLKKTPKGNLLKMVCEHGEDRKSATNRLNDLLSVFRGKKYVEIFKKHRTWHYSIQWIDKSNSKLMLRQSRPESVKYWNVTCYIINNETHLSLKPVAKIKASKLYPAKEPEGGGEGGKLNESKVWIGPTNYDTEGQNRTQEYKEAMAYFKHYFATHNTDNCIKPKTEEPIEKLNPQDKSSNSTDSTHIKLMSTPNLPIPGGIRGNGPKVYKVKERKDIGNSEIQLNPTSLNNTPEVRSNDNVNATFEFNKAPRPSHTGIPKSLKTAETIVGVLLAFILMSILLNIYYTVTSRN